MYIYMCVYTYTTKQAMHSAAAYHLLTNAQAGSKQQQPKQLSTISQVIFFFCMMSHRIAWPFGQFRSAVLVLSPVPPQFPSLGDPYKKLRNQNVLGSVQHCSATNENTGTLSTLSFLLKPKHHIIPDSVKKISSVPIDTRQAETQNVRMATRAL